MRLYIVWEQNHGDISYWLNAADAKNEIRRMLLDAFSGEDGVSDCWTYTDFMAADYGDICGYRVVELNKPWM